MRHMSRSGILAVLAVGALAVGGALAAGRAPRATTATSPQDEIAHEQIMARQEIMAQLEHLMLPVDTATVDGVRDAAGLREHGELMAAMLLALPHLFAPSTNRYVPTDLHPVTLTLPATWESFDRFRAMARLSAEAAEALADAPDDTALLDAARTLRARCDGCHALYLRKYEPPKPQASDAEFDFEAALGKE